MLPINMFQKVAITEYSQKAEWIKLPPKLIPNRMNGTVSHLKMSFFQNQNMLWNRVNFGQEVWKNIDNADMSRFGVLEQ